MSKVESSDPQIIIEEVITRIKHVVTFDSEINARKAYKKAVAFWEKSNHDAVQIEGREGIITVSTSVIASVSLFLNRRKAAQRKKVE